MITLPDLKRVQHSANGKFELVITRPKQLKPGDFPCATLYRNEGNKRELVWQTSLNIYIGPRIMLVSNLGYSILFDEWSRKRNTNYAIQVVSPVGENIRIFSLAEVAEFTGLSQSEISDSASDGPWLSKSPTKVIDESVEFEVGNVQLSLDIATATLKK